MREDVHTILLANTGDSFRVYSKWIKTKNKKKHFDIDKNVVS